MFAKIAAVILTISLLIDCAPAWAAPSAQEQPALQTCRDVDESTLLDELNGLTQQEFANALDHIDVPALVESRWAALGLDATVAAAVDGAVERVRSETDLWNKFLSGWSSDKARELTLTVANLAFADDAFRTSMDDLAAAVAGDIADQVGQLSAESVSAALYCLQTFITSNYSPVLLAAFEDNIRSVTSSDAIAAGSDLAPGLLDIIDQHKVALGGVGVIIAAQLTRRILVSIAENISKRVAGRIVGRVLGRIGTEVIPLAGWLIGAGLIVYDVYSGRDGALPEIQTTMKSPEMMAGIRAEIAASIVPELQFELPNTARTIANEMFNQWRAVKRDIRVVLDLAQRDAGVAALLGKLDSTERLSRLVDIVGAAQPAVGEAGVIAAANDGTLERLVDMPANPAPMVSATQSLQAPLAWADVAGDLFDEVVALEIYKNKAANEVDRGLVQKLVALDDKTVVARLTLLPPVALTTLLTLSTANVSALATRLSNEQLSWLADTLPQLEQNQRNALVGQLISNPEMVEMLRHIDLELVLSASSIDAALAFLHSPRNPLTWLGDVASMLTSAVSLRLFTAKYGWAITMGTGLLLLLLLLIILRILFGLATWLAEPFAQLLGRRR